MEVEKSDARSSPELLPSGWVMRPLGESLVARPRYGINAAAVPFSDRLPAYIRITDISPRGKFAPGEKASVDSPGAVDYFLDEGDIVFARTGASVGKSYLYKRNDGPLVFAGFLIKVRTDPGRLLPAFLAAYATTGPYWTWVRLMSMRSGQPGINGGEFAMLPVPHPPIQEQKAIVEALSDVDALLDTLDALMAKKRDLKQAVMRQLLTGHTRLPGFSGKWETKRLGDIAHIKTGSRNNEDKSDGGEYPFFVRSEVVERIHSYSHDCEAILVPGEGRIGSIFHYISGRFDVHQRVYAITRFASGVLGRYVHLYMSNNFGAWAMQNTVKATVDSLRLPTFLTFQIVLPPTIGEQDAIAAVLTDMDAEIAALEARRDKTRLLKQGMMQELLTGRTRLV